ncbi:MAG: phospholipid carrier-dependent glycosyltransferase [Verrucomicrobiota bacterium]|nr:phospholipid carrier-dependent glycosyltransferase [Verrucomicrobiota bacterium]
MRLSLKKTSLNSARCKMNWDPNRHPDLMKSLIALGLILCLGIAMRIYPSGAQMKGFDEELYRKYVVLLNANGVLKYPDICQSYINAQREMATVILPPTRFIYIYCGHAWSRLFRMAPLPALHSVSCAFTILTLLLSAVFTWRVAGPQVACAVAALMSFAPTQVHMSQHALIDGVFAFWALFAVWCLWENLRAPNHPAWLGVYALVLALMVMTKENAFFVFVALGGLILINRWAGFGKVTPALLIATGGGGLIGVLCLALLAGGAGSLIEIYKMVVTKASQLPYAIQFCDGPWHRYLLDLLLVSPLVMLLAIGEFFQLSAHKKPQLFLAGFVGFSYLVMANVQYGLNLRYANMWDMPLRFLAVSQLGTLAAFFGRRRALVFSIAIVVVCAHELWQYSEIFVRARAYELVSEGLLRAVKIVK